ncbi:monocarboxylate transporter 12-like [Stylophora pistillata]|nr:monocarboxylate transporter 12-like [Stylophora pistillata]
MAPYAQDGLWSWLVCASATLSWLAALGFVFSFGIFFPVFMDYFQESREKTAWVGSLAIAIIFFAGHASGALISKFGCRVTALLGAFLCALSLGVSSLAKNILVLYFTYSVLYGLGTSFVFSSSINIISKYFKKRRSLAMGILTCGQGAGVLIMAPVLQMMVDAYGWRTTYRMMAGVVFLICLTAVTYSPNVEGEDTEETSAEKEDEKRGCYIDVSVWKEPKVLVLIVSSTVIMFGHYTPQIHLVRYCEDIGITADAASRLFVYYGLASCAGRLVSGRLCDFKMINTYFVYQIAEIVAGMSILFVTMATSYIHMMVFIVIFGFCDGAYITTLNILAITCTSPDKTALALAWQMQMSSFTTASGPPIVGLVADSMDSYTPAFYMAGAAVLAGAFIPFFLLCRKERSASRDLWTTSVQTAESAGVPDWRKSVVYTIDKKTSIRDAD